MEYKEGDIVKMIKKYDIGRIPELIDITPFLFITIKDKTVGSDKGLYINLDLSFSNTANKEDNGYYVYHNYFELATKEDLVDYLKYIFTTKNFIIWPDNIDEAIKLNRLINKVTGSNNFVSFHNKIQYAYDSYGYAKWWCPAAPKESFKNNGFNVIDYKTIEYIIRKLNGL